MLRPFRLDREEFYQLFVHGIKDDRPLVLMLKKDELGQALRDNVQEKCPKLPSALSYYIKEERYFYPVGHHLSIFFHPFS